MLRWIRRCEEKYLFISEINKRSKDCLRAVFFVISDIWDRKRKEAWSCALKGLFLMGLLTDIGHMSKMGIVTVYAIKYALDELNCPIRIANKSDTQSAC